MTISVETAAVWSQLFSVIVIATQLFIRLSYVSGAAALYNHWRLNHCQFSYYVCQKHFCRMYYCILTPHSKLLIPNVTCSEAIYGQHMYLTTFLALCTVPVQLYKFTPKRSKDYNHPSIWYTYKLSTYSYTKHNTNSSLE